MASLNLYPCPAQVNVFFGCFKGALPVLSKGDLSIHNEQLTSSKNGAWCGSGRPGARGFPQLLWPGAMQRAPQAARASSPPRARAALGQAGGGVSGPGGRCAAAWPPSRSRAGRSSSPTGPSLAPRRVQYPTRIESESRPRLPRRAADEEAAACWAYRQSIGERKELR